MLRGYSKTLQVQEAVFLLYGLDMEALMELTIILISLGLSAYVMQDKR